MEDGLIIVEDEDGHRLQVVKNGGAVL